MDNEKKIGIPGLAVFCVGLDTKGIVVGLIALLLLSGTVGIACAGDWPMLQHDPHHTGYTDEKVSDDLELIWSFSLKSGGQPTVANGRVFVGSGDHKIYCLDENTGDLIWSYETGNKVPSTPAVADEKIFIGSGDGKIYCLDENNGNLIWSYKMGEGGGMGYSMDSSPVVADGKVFVGNATFYRDGKDKIYCLNVNSGNLIWNHEIPGGLYGSAVADGKIFVSSGNKILCFGPKEQPTPTIPTGGEEKETSGFEVVFALLGLLAVAYLLRRSKK